MTVPAALKAALAAGVSVRPEGDRLMLSAVERPNERLLDALRSEKAEIVDYLRGLAVWAEEDWQALFDERAGIMEFDGGLSRTEAEGSAKEEVEALQRLGSEKPR